jgi:putative FmdB family regulatory protein
VPTYQYVCTECGGQLEAVQRFTDDPLTVHDDCGGRLRKVFSPVGIVFKGSGFYRTDSRGTGSPNGTSASSAPVAAKDGGSSSADSSSAGSSSASGGEKAAAAPASTAASSSAGEKVA